MSTHSVEQHLHVTVETYDSMIRSFVPHYEEMLATAVALLGDLAPSNPRVLDLGGGTGALTQAVLRGLPTAKVELLDIDPQMLRQARHRLDGEDRVVFREGSYFGILPTSDAVVASLSLHHIHDLERKVLVYRSIRESLAEGGIFLNLDAVLSSDPTLRAHGFNQWARLMGEHGISLEAAHRHFKEWAEEDRYFSLHEEFTALAKAGFQGPECFWRRGPMAIYGGKPN